MTTPYTCKQLTDVEDSAPGFGLGDHQQVRFATDEIVDLRRLDALRVAPAVTRGFEAGPDGLELLVFGPLHEGDGEAFQDWWVD